MADQHVLDDREPETCPACGARPAAIDAIEPLGESRDLLGCNTDAGIGDGELAAIGAHAPIERDTTAVGRVAHRVADKIAECAGELVAAAEHIRLVANVEHDLVPAARKRLGVGRNLQQQRHDRKVCFQQHAVLALQRGERQEVIDQPLHVLRLLGH